MSRDRKGADKVLINQLTNQLINHFIIRYSFFDAVQVRPGFRRDGFDIHRIPNTVIFTSSEVVVAPLLSVAFPVRV